MSLLRPGPSRTASPPTLPFPHTTCTEKLSNRDTSLVLDSRGQLRPQPFIAPPSCRRGRPTRRQKRLSHPALSSVALLAQRVQGDNRQQEQRSLTMLFAAGVDRNRLLFRAASPENRSGQSSTQLVTPTESPGRRARGRADVPSPLEMRGSAQRRKRSGSRRPSSRDSAVLAEESEAVLAAMALQAVEHSAVSATEYSQGPRPGSPRSGASERLWKLSTQAAADKKRQKYAFPTYNGLPGYYRVGTTSSRRSGTNSSRRSVSRPVSPYRAPRPLRSLSAQFQPPQARANSRNPPSRAFKRSATPQPRMGKRSATPQTLQSASRASATEQRVTPVRQSEPKKLVDILASFQCSPPPQLGKEEGVDSTPEALPPAQRESLRSLSAAREGTDQFSDTVGNEW